MVPALTAADVADKLGGKPSGPGKWKALCPAHDDRDPSLSISEGPDGKVLLKCFSGCPFESITQAAGLDSRALMGPSGRNGSRPIRTADPLSRPEPDRRPDELKAAVASVGPLADTPGTEYVRSRGFDADACRPTRFTPDLYGRPAVCWPVEDLPGRRVALHGRHTDGREPKCHTVGALKDGVVWIPSAIPCRDAPELVLLEAPLDALALHSATGKPCAALCGTSLRPWLVEHLRGNRALLAFDGDEAGEKAAAEWAQALRQAGAEPRRLRPPEPFKDWAEAFQKLGKDGLREKTPEPEPIEAEQDAAAWPEPMPLDDTPEPPAFPTDALPRVLRDFVEAIAEHTQTPPDLPAILALGAVATACARTARIEGAPGWTEPLNLYACLALPSGSRKSAVVAACARPIEDFEAEECERRRSEIAANAAERATLEARLKALSQKAATCPPTDRLVLETDRNEAARELADMPEVHMPRLLCDDATPEVLARLMAEQKGRIACLSAEGSVVFEHAAGRYAENGSKLEVYLAGHPGDTVRVDRVQRKGEHVRSPALTLCLSVQPSVLPGVIARPENKGRGLLARFLWSVPRPTIGHRRLTTAPVPDAVSARYADCLRRLLRREPHHEPPVLRLSPDAAEAFLDYRAQNERELGEGERLEHLPDWGSKLPGLVLRAAALLHLAEHADAEPVSLEALQAAVRIGQYAEAHALLAFGMMGADADRAKAERLLAWVRRNGETVVTARDAYLKNRAMYKTPAEAERAIRLLVEYGHLRELPRTDGPGRPSLRFAVNPSTLVRNAQNAQNPSLQPDIEHIEHSVQGLTLDGSSPDPHDPGTFEEF